jgi:hypothetical protein
MGRRGIADRLAGPRTRISPSEAWQLHVGLPHIPIRPSRPESPPAPRKDNLNFPFRPLFYRPLHLQQPAPN